MNNNFEEIAKEARKVALTDQEKARMETSLLAFMDMHPTRGTRQIYPESNKSSWAWHLFSIFRPLQPSLLFGFLLVVTSVGVSYASEMSLPGETLYSVKVHVNEKVLGWATFSLDAEA